METPFDQRSNSIRSGSTGETVSTSLEASTEDRHSIEESHQPSDSRLAVIPRVDSDTVAVSSRRSSLCSNKIEVDRSVQEVSTPGCYGEVTVEHSSDVHFGNKIYTAPITVVNHLTYPEDDASLAAGYKDALKDPFAPPTVQKRPKRAYLGFRWSSRRLAVAVAIIVVITVSSALATIFIVLGGQLSASNSDDILIDASWFYTRDKWQAIPPKKINPLILPVPFVVIQHTATSKCMTHAACVEELLTIQNRHMYIDQKWWDIAYNYMVGGDDGVYVGRGANAAGSHTRGYNELSLGISFVGDYNYDAPSDLQMAHLTELIQEAVRLGKVMQDYQLFGHCQIAEFSSPGTLIMNKLREMPHWNNTNEKNC